MGATVLMCVHAACTDERLVDGGKLTGGVRRSSGEGARMSGGGADWQDPPTERQGVGEGGHGLGLVG